MLRQSAPISLRLGFGQEIALCSHSEAATRCLSLSVRFDSIAFGSVHFSVLPLVAIEKNPRRAITSVRLFCELAVEEQRVVHNAMRE